MPTPTAAAAFAPVSATKYNQVVSDLTDSGWIAPVLQGTWVNSGAPDASAGYRLLNEFVKVQGTVKSGAVAGGTVIFILPAGYRPLSRLRFTSLANGVVFTIFVLSTGEVELGGTVASTASVNLDPIIFPAEQ